MFGLHRTSEARIHITGDIPAVYGLDDELKRGEHFVSDQALQSVKNAVTIRGRAAKPEVTDGPFVETKEQIGGILFLEAKDLNQAIALILHYRCKRSR